MNHPSQTPKSVILIGMPGCGKSTLGVMLAKELGLGFVDTDILIQQREGKTLQQIIDSSDHLNLRMIEEQVLLENQFKDMVVATGGSVIYSSAGMTHLQTFGTLVYLQCPLAELEKRVDNYATRGIAAKPGQSLQSIAAEREALYERYASLTVETATMSPNEVVRAIVEKTIAQ